MEPQKTTSSQINLEKEHSWKYHTVYSQNILQSYTHESHMVLAKRNALRPMEQNRLPRIKYTHSRTTDLQQECQEYTMRKNNLFSTNGVEETGYSHEKTMKL